MEREARVKEGSLSPKAAKFCESLLSTLLSGKPMSLTSNIAPLKKTSKGPGKGKALMFSPWYLKTKYDDTEILHI